MPVIELESNVGRNLESLIDATSLDAVLQALSEIAYVKAEHLQANWGDRPDSPSVRAWKRAGAKLGRLRCGL